MLKALYANGRCVTGITHGHAFMLLSEEEKETCLSGMLDPSTNKFIGDDSCIYLKQLHLIRHAEWDDFGLTLNGIDQASKVADFYKNVDLDGYVGLTSPANRCQQTATIISAKTGIPFYTDAALSESEDAHVISCLRNLLDRLPEKCIIVTHADVISLLTYVATNGISGEGVISHASVTFIDQCRSIYFGRQIL